LSYASARRGVRLGEDKEAPQGCQGFDRAPGSGTAARHATAGQRVGSAEDAPTLWSGPTRRARSAPSPRGETRIADSEKAAAEVTDRVGLFRQSWLPLPEKAVNDRVQTPPPSRLR